MWPLPCANASTASWSMQLICQWSAVGVKHDWPPAVLPFNADDHQNAESRMERSITGHSPIAGQHNAMRSADNNNPNNLPNNISKREIINSFYIGNNLPSTIKTWFVFLWVAMSCDEFRRSWWSQTWIWVRYTILTRALKLKVLGQTDIRTQLYFTQKFQSR